MTRRKLRILASNLPISSTRIIQLTYPRPSPRRIYLVVAINTIRGAVLTENLISLTWSVAAPAHIHWLKPEQKTLIARVSREVEFIDVDVSVADVGVATMTTAILSLSGPGEDGFPETMSTVKNVEARRVVYLDGIQAGHPGVGREERIHG